MKKIIYSGFLKFVAVVLFVASIVAGTLAVSDGIIEFHDEEMQVYSFENSFEQSSRMISMLTYPESAVMDVYYQLFHKYDEDGRYIGIVDDGSVEQRELIKEKLEDWLLGSSYSDKIRYYVQWDDIVLTNCGAKSPEELMNGEFYSYVKREGLVVTERESSYADYRIYDYTIDYITGDRTIVISCNIKEEVVTEYRSLWENQQRIVLGTIKDTLICVGIALLMLVYLVCVCGKCSDGEYRTMWIDNIWAEVHLAAIAFFGVGAVAVCVWILDEYNWSGVGTNLIRIAVGSTAGLASAIIITSLLSIIRNIKCRRFIETSVIFRVIRWIFRGTVAFWRVIIKALSKKTGAILITMLLVYTAIIGLFGVFLPHSPVWLVLGILLFLFASFIIARRTRDLDEIKKGVRSIRCGYTSYKIPEPHCSDMQVLVGNINDIARGLDESVAAQVKAERLKTELITNVSHDLKTPITSIINYTELLSKMEDLPEEARDYVSVISKKSDRLKNLTQDLFDISKAQSGNESVTNEKLDVSLLINQSLGEHDSEIIASGLTFCVDAPKELCILADGRKMSRVLGNLINNILKYTMKNTRVFITAAERDGEVVMEFKNIASYPMNFSADEIAGRFVRGDRSRTAEGNGLGLAIAKSYTELCGGRFEIIVDGDMFKAILRFAKYN